MGKVRNFAAEKIQQELIAGHAKWHSEGLLYLFLCTVLKRRTYVGRESNPLLPRQNDA